VNNYLKNYFIEFSRSIFGGTVWSGFGFISNSVFYFLFLSISGKRVGAEGVGIIGVFYSVYVFLSLFVASGFRDFIVRKISEYWALNKKEKLSELHHKLKGFYLLISTLIIIILGAGANIITSKVFDNNFKIFIFFILSLLMFSFNIGARGFFIGKRNFPFVGAIFFLRGFILFISGILLFYWNIKNIEHYIFSFVISEFIGFLISFAYVFGSNPKEVFSLNIDLSIPIKNIFSMNISNSIIGSFFALPILLLKIKNVPPELIGNFTAEISLFQAVRTFFASFFVPLFPFISLSYFGGKKRKFFKYIIIGFSLISLVVLSFTFLIILFGAKFLNIFFSAKEFSFNKTEFLLLGFALLFHLFTRLFSRIFFGTKKEKYVWKILVIWFIMLTLPFLYFNFQNPILSLLVILILSTLLCSLIFFTLFLKIFTYEGSIPEKGALPEE
jgi:O-antigen/teichoic acid export membrane protein